MRLSSKIAALAGICIFAPSPALAIDELIIVGDSRDIPSDEPRWVVCMRWDRANDYKYVSNIRRSTYGETRGQLTWGDFVANNFPVSDDLYGGCNVEESEKDANWRYNLFREIDPNFPKTLVEVNWTGPITQSAKEEAKSRKKPQVDERQVAADTKTSGPTPAEIAAEKHRAVEERNRRAQENYEAELAAQKRKVDEYERAKEEVARKKAEQQAAAQRVLAQYDSEKSAHEATLRAHEAQMAAYKAEVDAAAGKIVSDFDKRHGLKASTATDANRCVTTPETRLNATTKGNTAASVTNGCGEPVDVRICLMTDRGWNCGVTYGLGSQQSWSWSSYNATGPVFSDARTSGSSRSLASPK